MAVPKLTTVVRLREFCNNASYWLIYAICLSPMVLCLWPASDSYRFTRPDLATVVGEYIRGDVRPSQLTVNPDGTYTSAGIPYVPATGTWEIRSHREGGWAIELSGGQDSPRVRRNGDIEFLIGDPDAYDIRAFKKTKKSPDE